jgi:transcriptional regulator with XRE-family HTH domain
MQQLVDYLEKQGISRAQAARDLGISKSYMTEILKGDAVPGRALIFKIDDWTGGAVAVTSWRESAA